MPRVNIQSQLAPAASQPLLAQIHRDVDLYFLGPKPFMQAVYRIARELGVPEAQTRFEFFGPREALAIV